MIISITKAILNRNLNDFYDNPTGGYHTVINGIKFSIGFLNSKKITAQDKNGVTITIEIPIGFQHDFDSLVKNLEVHFASFRDNKFTNDLRIIYKQLNNEV